MTTELVWLKKADWGGQLPFFDASYDDAHNRAVRLWDEYPWNVDPDLSDGSIAGDWRLPNKSELYGISVGTEYIRSSQMYFFTGVIPDYYWSSSYPYSREWAWIVNMFNGYLNISYKTTSFYVWPVRSGH